MKDMILKYVLQNSIRFNGKPSFGAILGKVLGENQELKKDVKDIQKQIKEAIKEVAKMSVEQQTDLLNKTAPEMLEKKTAEKRIGLPPLKDAVKGKVVTAFPPEPSGYLHIGHAKGAILNYEYAKEYNGKFILRFEDTNPELAKKEFYEAQINDFKWLGIQWDELVYISDTIPNIYKKTEELIKNGFFYACDCSIEDIRNKRMHGEECECRNRSPEESMKLFKGMLNGKFEKGEVIIRWKGRMDHKNTAMRDPTMLRVIKKSHDRVGNKYFAWPSYDLAAAFSDGTEGITHRVRSKEYELRAELQRELQKQMGFKPTNIMEQARFNLEGVEASKRKIREKIAMGELTGWDDPRLSTIVALKRRGFVPEAIKNFLLKMSITKHESTMNWDNLETENRKIIDSVANRYFFIQDPAEVLIEGAPEQECKINIHPEHPERGARKFKTHERFYLSKSDVKQLKPKKLYRLMDCLNFTRTAKGFKFDSKDYESYKQKGEKIMHWLPVNEKNTAVEIMMPGASIVKGVGEKDIRTLKVGGFVQFERFGFCHLDRFEKDKVVFWFTHK